MTEGEPVEVQAFWEDFELSPSIDAEVRLFLRDETQTQVDRDTQGGTLATVPAVPTSDGQWSVAVLVLTGSASYEVEVFTNNDVRDEPL